MPERWRNAAVRTLVTAVRKAGGSAERTTKVILDYFDSLIGAMTASGADSDVKRDGHALKRSLAAAIRYLDAQPGVHVETRQVYGGVDHTVTVQS